MPNFRVSTHAPALLKSPSVGLVEAHAEWIEGLSKVGLLAEMQALPGERLEFRLELLGFGRNVHAELTVLKAEVRPGTRVARIEASIADIRPSDADALQRWLAEAMGRRVPVSLPPFGAWQAGPGSAWITKPSARKAG